MCGCTGPLFIIRNRASAVDPLQVGAALVRDGREPGVLLYTVSKRELFHNPVLG